MVIFLYVPMAAVGYLQLGDLTINDGGIVCVLCDGNVKLAVEVGAQKRLFIKLREINKSRATIRNFTAIFISHRKGPKKMQKYGPSPLGCLKKSEPKNLILAL